MVSKKTKIVATIGPATDTVEKMQALISAGVKVFRFNMKHNSVEWHRERIARANQVANDMGLKIGIFIDLQGPEIRISTKDQQAITVTKGDSLIFVNSFTNPAGQVCIPHPEVFALLQIGDSILIDDGFQEFKVTDKSAEQLTGVAQDNYQVEDHKGLNLPGKISIYLH
jgi:pyruvate kinase